MKRFLLLACLVFTLPLAAETKILAISGSTRTGSYNNKLIQEAASIARKMGATVTVVNLKDYSMPFYDADIETRFGLPANAKQLRDQMIGSDAIIIATPEYNGSISAVLKNTIDWASRDQKGQPSMEPFKGKKFALMSISPGGGGGSRALAHLRDIIKALGGIVNEKQLAVPNATAAFNDAGNLSNEGLREQLEQEIKQLLSKD